jgi:KUP system potassium uptake protein
MNKTKKGMLGLSIGALGVVFGDIGTSPLYALNAIFSKHGFHIAMIRANILGVISLVIWSVVVVVSFKYICFVMKADNKGEGGIMALVALIKSSKLRDTYKRAFIVLGIIGVALFYGDSTITPAISVLSAVEGLKIVAPSLTSLIIPITVTILAALFAIQRYGTGTIGKLFGPVMLLWFITIAAGGSWQIGQHPSVLAALSPLPALQFFITQPGLAFIAMGAVILAITGAEALYADMGHFGRQPISKAWFFVVFPALILCYMGEGALLLHNPASVANPLLLMFPAVIRIPVVLLATMATIIASQAVISGAFSLTRQAMQLNFLPKMLLRHTSSREGGQIYLPYVNAVLFVLVIVLVITFGTSARLANTYGIAVSGTLATDTILYLVVLRSLWNVSLRKVLLAAIAFVPLDVLFVTSSLPKILRGGWLPILIGLMVYIVITTWLHGQRIVVKERRALEGPLQDFIDKLHNQKPPLRRIPGVAIYIGHHADLAPLALHATVDDLHELHEKVVIMSVEITNVAHIPEAGRAVVDELGYNDGISHVSLSYGFHDSIHIPEALKYLRTVDTELDFDAENASYFISLSRIVPSRRHNMASWQKYLYCMMARNAVSMTDYYKLPIERTLEMRTLIKL